MSKTFRPYAPEQSELLPPSPREWLPAGHVAYFILDTVAELDLRPLLERYERELRGYPPHHPRMMVGLLLYGYCVGVASSRKIEKKTYEDIAFRVIAAGQHPDHSTVSEFRRQHLDVLAGLFVQVLALCQKAGLVQLGHVALDGTKLKANASKHKAMSYERMQQREKELAEKVAALLKAAEAADAAEDKLYGKKKRGDELPEELQRAETRLARIRAAKAELEAEAKAARAAQQAEKQQAEKQQDGGDEPPSGPTPLPRHQVQSEADGPPKPKAQRNFTDPESRIQKTQQGFIQGFNAQAAVDAAHQIIVAQALTNQPPDVEHFLPLLEQVVENCGEVPQVTTADAGYFSEENLTRAASMGINAYVAVGRQKHGVQPPAVRGRMPRELSVKDWMARRLRTKAGRQVYARRKAVAEPPFGQIKQARGFRQLLLRGLKKARGEWALICLTHNLLKLHRAQATA
ncbi:IS1182 family transposase [Corallococcus sp. CA049B]|uniref:IS1182 family transposase n=1 Tax=Corallococcus sp. CA049B TaxID=2316730 RepID=UPI000EA33346|nr:IS1182 family transposase [Corallococcus sp. CA049B]RKG84403.1 IS1182 family transposase [Corallococcus sp. CA049B]